MQFQEALYKIERPAKIIICIYFAYLLVVSVYLSFLFPIFYPSNAKIEVKTSAYFADKNSGFSVFKNKMAHSQAAIDSAAITGFGYVDGLSGRGYSFGTASSFVYPTDIVPARLGNSL